MLIKNKVFHIGARHLINNALRKDELGLGTPIPGNATVSLIKAVV